MAYPFKRMVLDENFFVGYTSVISESPALTDTQLSHPFKRMERSTK
jgi:hypothetical protein